VQGGAVRINDISIADDKLVLSSNHVGSDGTIKVSVGRKKHVLLRIV
jgi:tyrosyl-tRNA synthetase